MDRIRLGGIKIAEGRSHLVAARAAGESALPEICGRLGANRVNLNHLASSLADDRGDEINSLSVDREDGFTSYFQIRALLGGSDRVQLVEDVSILAVFPHDKKPGVTGNLLQQLASMSIPVHGLASTPAAMAFVAAAADTARVIDGLFEAFIFPAYPSPFDWHAAYQGQEQVLREIICSYEEQVIKVYNVAQETDLDLWCLGLPVTEQSTLGAVFHELERQGIRLPFLVAVPTLTTPESLRFSFGLARSAQPGVRDVLTKHFPNLDPANPCLARPAALFTLVGPHFGDRHGITRTLVDAMGVAGIHPLAMSCAVHSISVVVPAADLDRTLQALAGPFDIPS